MRSELEYIETCTIAASVDTVFNAVASNAGLAGWWTPLVGGDPAEVDSVVTLRFEGLDEHLELRVAEIDRGHRVAFECLVHAGHPEWVGTTIHFDLAPGPGGGTTLTLRHEGLTAALSCFNTCRRGWEHFLASLTRYAQSGSGDPYRAPTSADVDQDGPVPAADEPLHAHAVAISAFQRVLGNITADHLDLPTPCEQWSVFDVIHHVTTRNQWVAGLPADAPRDLDHLRAASAVATQAAHRVFTAPDGLTRLYETPLGAIPGAVFIGLRTTDALVHAWDIAIATGQPTDLAPDVADAMLAMSRQRVTPELRAPGSAFGPEQPAPANSTAADRLAAFLGRTATTSRERPNPSP